MKDIDWNMFMPDQFEVCCIKVGTKRAYIDYISKIDIEYSKRSRVKNGSVKKTKYPSISYVVSMNSDAKEVISELYKNDVNPVIITIKEAIFEINHSYTFPCTVRSSFQFLKSDYRGWGGDHSIKIDIVIDDTDMVCKKNLKNIFKNYRHRLYIESKDEFEREDLIDI